MTKEIPLTQGKVALVSDHRFEYLSQWEWYAYKDRETWYAARAGRKTDMPGTKFPKRIQMHRVILKAPAGVLVDHKDNNGLNNVDENLRLSTYSENRTNCKKNRNNTSGFKGVILEKRASKFRARIMVNGKSINLGLFFLPEDAARAYDEAAKKYHGDFAQLNFND